MKLFKFITIFNGIFLICNAAEFSYSSQNEWESYCSSGEIQSPIQIKTSIVDVNAVEDFQLVITDLKNQEDATIENDGVTILSQNNWVGFTASDVEKRPRTYEAETITFHSPSEHTIDEIQPDLELQILATQTSGYTDNKIQGILSLLFVEAAGEDNAILQGFLNFIDYLFYLRNQDSDGSQFQDINLHDVLFPLLAHYNSSLYYYTYQGSITIPPCREAVNWYIIKNYFPISTTQLKVFQSLWSGNSSFAAGAGNNRNLQLLKEREIAIGKAYVDKLSSVALTVISSLLAIFVFVLLI